VGWCSDSALNLHSGGPGLEHRSLHELSSLRFLAVSSGNFRDNTVTCIPIARQRLGKHISARANARNYRTSIVRQRSSKHASLKKRLCLLRIRAKWL
jgi:hypothetical protein